MAARGSELQTVNIMNETWTITLTIQLTEMHHLFWMQDTTVHFELIKSLTKLAFEALRIFLSGHVIFVELTVSLNMVKNFI